MVKSWFQEGQPPSRPRAAEAISGGHRYPCSQEQTGRQGPSAVWRYLQFQVHDPLLYTLSSPKGTIHPRRPHSLPRSVHVQMSVNDMGLHWASCRAVVSNVIFPLREEDTKAEVQGPKGVNGRAETQPAHLISELLLNMTEELT